MRHTGTWLPVLAILAGACGARSGLDVGESGSPLPTGTPASAGNGNGGGAPASANPQAAGAGGGSAGAPPKPAIAIAIAAGTDTTCALKDDGTVWCWGSNKHGELGNGTTTDSSVPVQVAGIDSAVAIAAGGAWTMAAMRAGNSTFNCAVLRDGSVQCWGNAPSGGGSSVPVLVPGIDDATAVAGGNWHACALARGGSIQCWGDNHVAQLGNGSLTNSREPVTVLGLSDAIDVAGLGSNFTCALLKAGAVECWGTPEDVPVERGWTAIAVPLEGPKPMGIAAGYENACAVSLNGDVQCWRGMRPPAAVPDVHAAVAVSVGRSHACALLSEGTIQCWGEDYAGQLGITTDSPTTVSGIHDAVAVSAGWDYSCAVLKAGTAWCWGVDRSGQLGIGDDEPLKASHHTPVQVRGL